MLSFFRAMAKSKLVWLAIFLPTIAGLMTIGSVRQDLSGIFEGKDTVIKAGSRAYKAADFKREFDAYRKQTQEQGQPAITAEQAVSEGIDQRMLQTLAERESSNETLYKLGVKPSDKLVAGQIAKIPAFFDPISGKFDKKTYAQRLQENGLEPDPFLRSLRDEVAYNHFAAGMAAGLKPPRLYGAMLAAYLYEDRALSLFALDPKILGEEPKPTDADLTKLMKDHAAGLTVPETRTLTVVRFSAAALASTTPADPAEVKKRYDFRKDTLSTPDTRSLLQISVKDAAEATAVAGKLKAGQDPAAVAKSVGAQPPLTYTYAGKATVADSKVADVAFTLPEGGVSGPIQGNLGWAVVKVSKVNPGKTVTFEEARPQIEKEVQQEAAANKAYDLVQKYEDAHGKGSTLVEAAKAAGVTPITFAPVTAGGQDAGAQPVQGLSPRLLKEAFALPQGGETDAVQDTKGEYFAVRVDKIIPPALPSLDKIRPRLLQAYLQQEMSKRLEAKLNELAARVRKGESLDAVAASVGAKVAHLSLNRNLAQQSRTLPPQLAANLFAAKVGDVVITGGGLARVDAINPPAPGVVASAMDSSQLTLARAIFSELQQEGRTYARSLIKPKVNITVARQAIGVTDDKAAPPAGAAPGAAGSLAK